MCGLRLRAQVEFEETVEQRRRRADWTLGGSNHFRGDTAAFGSKVSRSPQDKGQETSPITEDMSAHCGGRVVARVRFAMTAV